MISNITCDLIYTQLLIEFQPKRIKSLDDPEYERVSKECQRYFELGNHDILSDAQQEFYDLLCGLINDAERNYKDKYINCIRCPAIIKVPDKEDKA